MSRSSGLRPLTGAAVTILLLVLSIVAQQNARELYQRARMLDDTNQNLGEAIKLYTQVVTLAKEQRALAARAQYQIGLLYERLGRKADAQRAFKIVVSQFADQIDLARNAQARLAAAGPEKKSEDSLVKQSGPSPDGQYLATFTFPAKKGLGLLRPIIDAAAHRLYLVTHTEGELSSDVASKRAERKGLRQAYGPSALVVINTDKNSVDKTLPLQVYFSGVGFNPATNKLYGAAQASGHVRVIDVNTLAQTKIPVPGYPSAIAVNPTTNKIYVTSQGYEGNDKLFVIDGVTNVVAGPFDLDGVAAEWLVVNSATNRVYVSTQEPAKTRVFNGADNSVLADLAGIQVTEADPVHNRLYAYASSTSVTGLQVLDGDSHSLILAVGLAGNVALGRIAVDPDVNRLYVILEERNQIAVIDTATHTELGRLSVAGHPVRLNLDRTTGRAYVCFDHSSPDAAPALSVLAKRALEEGPEEFSDDFDALTLDPAWTSVTGRGSYSLAENPGHLRFHVAATSGPASRLLLLRRFRGDFWTFETRVSYVTGTSGGSRTLTFGITFGSLPAIVGGVRPADGVYLLRVREDWNGCCPGETRLHFNENDLSTTNTLSPNPDDGYVWRIKRNGRTITVERSDDGINFTLVGSHTFGAQIEGIIQFLGISYSNHANNDAYADYDYVRLTRTTPSQTPR